MVNVKMSVKRIKCAKKDCQKYLKSINHSIIACDETISVMNNLSTNLTNTVSTMSTIMSTFIIMSTIKDVRTLGEERGQAKVNKCRQGEAVVSQMWTPAWKKDYSNHVFVTFTEIN